MTNVKTPDQWEAVDLIDILKERRGKTNEIVLENHSRALIWIIRRMDLTRKTALLKPLGYGIGLGLAFAVGKLAEKLF